MAVKTALEALDAQMRGEDVSDAVEIFRSFAEAVTGGPRTLDFGGKVIANKRTNEENFLRAAAVELWENFPEERDALAKDAKKIIGIRSEASLRKLVENFRQRHDYEVSKSRSPLSAHMARVRDLIKNHGYRHLKDFT